MKLLKTAVILGAGAAVGAVALTVYARKKVAAYIDDPTGAHDEAAVLQAGAVLDTARGVKDDVVAHVSMVAEAVREGYASFKAGPTS